MKRLKSEESKIIGTVHKPELAGVYDKRGRLVFSGTIEECVWHCKTHKSNKFTIQIIPE